jgi:hypothetical protein
MGTADDMNEIRRLIEEAEAEALDPHATLHEAGIPQEFIDNTVGQMGTEWVGETFLPITARNKYVLGWWNHYLALQQRAQKRGHPPK